MLLIAISGAYFGFYSGVKNDGRVAVTPARIERPSVPEPIAVEPAAGELSPQKKLRLRSLRNLCERRHPSP